VSRFPILEKQSADPAAGQEFIFTADEDMIVWSLSFTFVTSATVATRIVTLKADDGADIYFRGVMAAAGQTASLTVGYSGWSGSGATAVAQSAYTIQWPVTGLRMRKGDRLQSLTQAIDAGDNFSAVVLEVERI
jgi:hypothetical protein